MSDHCQNCAAKLWSDYSKQLGVCPECESPDTAHGDLEDMLEFVYQSTDRKADHAL